MSPPGGAKRGVGGGRALLDELWSTGAIWLYPALFFSVLGMTLVVPFMADIQTNFFATQDAAAAAAAAAAAGATAGPLGPKGLQCQDFAAGTEPSACRNAHSTVALWSSWSSLLSNSVVSVIALPLVGSLSDRYGRKPFLVLAQALILLHLACLSAFVNFGTLPLYAYYFANVFSGSQCLVAVAFAYLADEVAPASRTVAFGLVMACFSGAFLLGPVVGVLLSPGGAVLAATATSAANIAFMAVAVPEPKHRGEGGGGVAARPAGVGVLGAFRILRRSPLFARLSLVMMLVGMAENGLQNILAQYLQIKLNFQAKDIVVLFVVLGVGGLVVQGLLLRPLKAALGERSLLALAMATSTGANVLTAAARSRGAVWVAMAVFALNEVAVPAIASLKSNNAAADEQGAVQGALYGGRSLAQGVGPLLYASVFAAFTREGSALPVCPPPPPPLPQYFPGAPFVLATGGLTLSPAPPPPKYFPGAPFVLGAGLAAAAFVIVRTITPEMDDGRGGARGGAGVPWVPLPGEEEDREGGGDGEGRGGGLEGRVTVAGRRHLSGEFAPLGSDGAAQGPPDV